jgi:hypothetical protein
MSLYQEDNHQRLTTDPTIYTPSSNGHLLGFLPYRTSITPAFCREAIIVGPQFNVAVISIFDQPTAQLYPMGVLSTLVIDVGKSQMDIAPIYDGLPLPAM